MSGDNIKSITVNRFLFAVIMVAVSAALRIWPLGLLESKLVWLTFYPSVMIVAVYGGLAAGLLAMGLACFTAVFLWPLLVATPFINNTGDWLGMSVFAMTCTMMSGVAEAMLRAKKSTEITAASLKDSETRLLALFNTPAIGIVVIDEQGCIEEFNPGSEAIFAYSKEEVIGQNINMLMPEPYHSEHDNYLKNYLAGGRAGKVIGIEQELPGQRKGNTTFPLQLNVGEAKLGNHRIFVGFIQDISKRRQMESASRHFEAIVQSSDDAIMSKNLEGIVTSWNASAERMFGFTAEEMIGHAMFKLFSAEQIDEEKLIMEQIARGQRVNHFETVRLRKDGSPIDVSVSLSPIFDEAGKVVGASKIARDITQSKRAEQELYEAKQAAEAANHSKSEFLANMSHEIRTPMNAIIGLTRLASETELTPKQQDYLHKIQASSQALLGILNDILDLSKIESGRMDIERIEFNPTLMLQGVSDLFIAKAEEKGLEIFLDVAPEIPLTVLGDPLRIQQVLTNLVSNAIKFTPKGEIHVRMELEEGGDDLLLRLSVRDTGIGIDDAAIGHLFQPFSQADASTTRKFGGSGLGLVISKQLVELMGGSITMSSQPGQGSIFSFTIRCGKGQAYNWNQDSLHLKGTHVLVVDDQETSCIILKNILESWRFQVTTVLSAEEALQRVQQAEQAGEPFDLLLVDWQMEGMSGLELVQELGPKEAQGKLKHRPTIIMVTAYSKEQLLKEAADTSAQLDAVLTKPVVPSGLFNTILHVYHHQGKDQRIPETPADPYEIARPLRNAHILLVEDNELNQQVAGEFLEKAGLRISIANHGGEAVQRVERENFDAVLMDLQMPEMDGYEATRRIRELPGCENLPIIAMTAAAMQHDREACLAAGMNDHVVKPINPRELIDALLHWVKPTEQQQCISPTPPAIREVWSDLANQLPGFELRDIMTMLGGNQGQLMRMLTAFREQFIGEAASIASQITEGSMDAARKRLHTLKGAAGNLGVRDLYQASAALDAQLASGLYDVTTLSHWLRTFDRAMATLADMPCQQLPIAPVVISADARQQLLAELDALLVKDSFISDELLSRLKTVLPDEQQADYADFAQYILDTDYPRARSVLNTLMSLPNGKS
jgi:PAS domain S-box-containing protein